MSNDDALFRFRLRLFALAKELGSVRAACRMLGVHHSMYYRWLRQLVRFGPEILRPRERRRPRMPNALTPILEQKVLGLALAYPGWGPARLSAELGREKWGGLKVSANGVWRVLRRHGLSTRARRLGLVAGYAVAHSPAERPIAEQRHIEANYPGHRVLPVTDSGLNGQTPTSDVRRPTSLGPTTRTEALSEAIRSRVDEHERAHTLLRAHEYTSAPSRPSIGLEYR